MNHSSDLSPDDLRRLPGLFRRWELTEIFEPNRFYRIEDAGTHADGTPLLAVYVADPASDARHMPPERIGALTSIERHERQILTDLIGSIEGG